jgi:hypothetical protein
VLWLGRFSGLTLLWSELPNESSRGLANKYEIAILRAYHVKMSEQCSVTIANGLEKQKDPGCLTIPCCVGSFKFDKALCDLGGSVNVMPRDEFEKPTFNNIVMAEDLAAGTPIPLGKCLLGSVYHMLHQTTYLMQTSKKILCVNGPWWFVQMWLQLYMHQIVAINLNNWHFPSTNDKEGET